MLLGNVGMRFPSQKLLWDGEAMTMTNVAEANEVIQHKYREGWGL